MQALHYRIVTYFSVLVQSGESKRERGLVVMMMEDVCSEWATDGPATFTSSLAIRSPHNTLQGGSDQQHLQELVRILQPHNKETCMK